jgi:hypothetical protein
MKGTLATLFQLYFRSFILHLAKSRIPFLLLDLA